MTDLQQKIADIIRKMETGDSFVCAHPTKKELQAIIDTVLSEVEREVIGADANTSLWEINTFGWQQAMCENTIKSEQRAALKRLRTK